ncbi:DHA2 family efflux MFS transporter permease subunit [Bartonella sp. LJL80]
MRILPLVLAVALFMENMDSNVISTSLPAIAADLHTSPIALKLAMTSYLVSLSVFIPISGWMADRFTARNIFRIAICIFLIGSLCCAASFSLESFVFSRFLQGLGGAMMTPVGRLLLVKSTPKEELVVALAWLSVPALAGPLVGPPIGGFITTYFSWHWIFLINIPIGLIGLVLSTIFLPRDEQPTFRKLDWIGFVLSGTAMSGFIFGLSVISLPALPEWVGFSLAIIGVFCAFLYVRHAKKIIHPLLDLTLFRDQVFARSIIGGSIFRLGIGAIPFLLPMMLQLAFGLSPIQSGMITFVGAIGSMGMKFGAKEVYARFGFRKVLMTGSVISALFTASNGLFFPDTPYWIILLALLIGGFLRSLFFSGVNALSFAHIDKSQMSQATPLSAVAQQASLALGVAIAGAVLEGCTTIHGGTLQLADFHIAFFVISAISALAFFNFRKLPADAGHELNATKQKIIKNQSPV